MEASVSGDSAIGGVGAGPEAAFPAGEIARSQIRSDLIDSFELATRRHRVSVQNLLRIGIELSLYWNVQWKRRSKIVVDSVETLDKTRADAQTLLWEDATEADAKR